MTCNNEIIPQFLYTTTMIILTPLLDVKAEEQGGEIFWYEALATQYKVRNNLMLLVQHHPNVIIIILLFILINALLLSLDVQRSLFEKVWQETRPRDWCRWHSHYAHGGQEERS